MTLRVRWQALALRDRQVLAAGAAFVGVLLLWAWVWDPLAKARTALRTQAADNEAALAWMRPAAEALAAKGGVGAEAVTRDARSLLARVDAGARAAGLGPQLSAVEPLGEARVRVQFNGADFDALARWVEGLGGQGVRIEEWSVARAAGPGRVDSVLQLQEAPR